MIPPILWLQVLTFLILLNLLISEAFCWGQIFPKGHRWWHVVVWLLSILSLVVWGAYCPWR